MRKKKMGAKKKKEFSQTGFASDVRRCAAWDPVWGHSGQPVSIPEFRAVRAHEFRATCFTYKGSAQFRAPWPGHPPLTALSG